MTNEPSPVGFAPPLEDHEPYDEFALVAQNAAEMGVEWPGRHLPRRVGFTRSNGQALSVIRWGDADPEVVFLHGGGQNAHTWDSVVVALDRPALAIDLPGHGHSDRRSDGNYGPWENALAVAEVVAAMAPNAVGVVGMSLGGATTTRLAATRPDLVRRAVIVDVTPSVNDPGRVMTPEQRGTVALVSGPPTYESFESVFEVTMAASPFRTEAGVRRGLRHNMVRLADGRWRWRYDLGGAAATSATSASSAPVVNDWVDFTPMWDDVANITVPTMLMVGGESVFVLPADIDEFRTRLPSVVVEVVAGAGHAVQSDQPAAMVALLDSFLVRTP
jgi:pimeloyl-ACP methyl ester carboxylesterase